MNTEVEINREFKQKLTRLWFLYGNNGKLHTNGNHKFIQRLVEHVERGTYWSEQEWKLNKKFYAPTNECYDAVVALVKERGAQFAQLLPKFGEKK
jgi:hypothetical protein